MANVQAQQPTEKRQEIKSPREAGSSCCCINFIGRLP